VWALREGTPDMCQRDQTEDRAGGDDVGFHVDPSVRQA
jgi:hypothetical protein